MHLTLKKRPCPQEIKYYTRLFSKYKKRDKTQNFRPSKFKTCMVSPFANPIFSNIFQMFLALFPLLFLPLTM